MCTFFIIILFLLLWIFPLLGNRTTPSGIDSAKERSWKILSEHWGVLLRVSLVLRALLCIGPQGHHAHFGPGVTTTKALHDIVKTMGIRAPVSYHDVPADRMFDFLMLVPSIVDRCCGVPGVV